MKPKKWTVVYTGRSAYEGLGETAYEAKRTHHRTYLGADFHRRFRARIPTMGNRWVETEILCDSKPLGENRPERLATVLEDYVWPALYWLRNHWDGLRWGLDRDRRA